MDKTNLKHKLRQHAAKLLDPEHSPDPHPPTSSSASAPASASASASTSTPASAPAAAEPPHVHTSTHNPKRVFADKVKHKMDDPELQQRAGQLFMHHAKKKIFKE
ncbi:unnamed protein product [Agarophyton chilense]|eukprot:gb/GEZJ01004719.1/.p4 GENE.gb/GEZJ01004719.1/~~gb/GEZJ01004719.1/.p4  ORF type:complete len:105 (-),score=27.09 gb/GEZJ01004719.1/:523-837(-)